jgi:hypothetical protein
MLICSSIGKIDHIKLLYSFLLTKRPLTFYTHAFCSFSDQNNGNPNFIPDQQDDFEAREDNDVLLQEDEDVNGSDEGEGDDLEENLDG